MTVTNPGSAGRQFGERIHVCGRAHGDERITEQWSDSGWYGGDDHGDELCCGSDGDVWRDSGDERGGGGCGPHHGYDTGACGRSGDGDGNGQQPDRNLANGFTYNAPPTVTSVSPNNGPAAGGTAVTITGTNFAAGATVTFGVTAATNVVVVDAAHITATTPAGSVGAVTVTVTVNGQSGSLANGFTYNAAVAISFAQVAAATPQSSTATVPVTFPGAQTVGDLNIVVVGWNDTTAAVQSVKDSAGNTYNLAIGPTSGTALQQSIYYAANIVGGSNTVTVTFNQAAAYPDIRILEYRGVTTLDAKAGCERE